MNETDDASEPRGDLCRCASANLRRTDENLFDPKDKRSIAIAISARRKIRDYLYDETTKLCVLGL